MIGAEDGGEVDRVSVIVVPSAGLMRWEDPVTWVTLPSDTLPPGWEWESEPAAVPASSREAPKKSVTRKGRAS